MTGTDDLDPAVYSNEARWVTDPAGDGGRYAPVTWKELAEERQKEVTRLQAFQTIVSDLDRNPNGRHEGDADVGDHTGISQGNPRFTTGDVVGYRLGGKPIIMPPREKRNDPTAWLGGWP